MRADREFVLTAAAQERVPLKHASEDMRADGEFVRAAAAQQFLPLKNASAERRLDRELVLAAATQQGMLFRQPPRRRARTASSCGPQRYSDECP